MDSFLLGSSQLSFHSNDDAPISQCQVTDRVTAFGGDMHSSNNMCIHFDSINILAEHRQFSDGLRTLQTSLHSIADKLIAEKIISL